MPSHAKPSLEAGLVALKQGNYQTAIAQLEPIASSQSNGTASLQAQVGLVMAYARIGEASKAIAISQNLIESNNPQVQEWATRALEHLTKRQKRDQESKNVETGFVAFDNSTPDSTPVPPPETPTLEEQPKDQVIETKTDDTPPMVPLARLKATVATPLPAAGSVPLSGFMGSVTRTQAKLFGVIYWRQAQRARAWQPLRKPKLIPLRLLTAGTFIALFWVIREMLKLALGFINQTLITLPYLEPLELLYRDPTKLLLIVLVILIGVSPWLLDLLLANLYGQREFSKDVLNAHSREAVRVLQRCCQQRHWPLPKLRILPMAAPIILTYGSLPRNARIVVSQGLLEQLADDEIAIIYATQLGHITHWDFAVMSLLLLVTLPIHKLYQQVSNWGDKISGKIWRSPVTILASIVYGVWCLLTGTALWLSRLRLYYSDRVASEITGNPNALIRALLKIAIGIAADIQKQEQTSWQLESLNLLTPVSYQQSLSLGTIASNLSFESFLKWDTANPYRRWFTINNSHPLMGDRIERLCQIARHWHLDTELHFASEPSKVKRQSFLLQIAPWLGIPLGVLFAAFVWQTLELTQALQELKQTQTRLIQGEKMAGLGQLLAGVAHEINNPVSFIFGNLIHLNEYTQELLNVVKLYRQNSSLLPNVQEEIDKNDLDFLMEDLPKTLESMKVGTERIREIVLSLRNFSRTDEAELKPVDIHQGLDSTLLILGHRLKNNNERPAIEIVKKYATLPLLECYPAQLNQVFMNLLSNSIDALEEKFKTIQQRYLNLSRKCPTIPLTIWITTQVVNNQIVIRIADNGLGIPEEVRSHMFDPFFTTKAPGKGTGLGLSISHQIIVEKHHGQIKCSSKPGEGTEFLIEIPSGN
ncbi:ATP-binding protein [Nostoc sp. CHAB 5715]|uniref:ATP-binding protein n=1 Tax=Nostoc sp. CHAB 5715 TaxID=2780400 RepID=UPI001E309ADA|nr:ATP-binding protein [Nostoc sp. CHAB 5715]MCC5621880.1 M48 family metalloprotease [Nostoc sp. CHAB 5715]